MHEVTAIDLRDYIDAAIRFENPDVRTDPGARRANAAHGIFAEAGEINNTLKRHRHQGHPLDAAELVDESGDLCWYCGLLIDVCGIAPEAVDPRLFPLIIDRDPDPIVALSHLGLELGRPVGRITSLVVVGRARSPVDYVAHVGELLRGIHDIAGLLNVGFDVVLEHNLAKLRRRYPSGGFSPAESRAT